MSTNSLYLLKIVSGTVYSARHALTLHDDNIAATALALGIAPNTLAALLLLPFAN